MPAVVRDMTTPRGFRDRADDSLFTLIGDIPELIRNLVIAEVDAGKSWVKRTAKDAGVGAVWIGAALFFLFWTIPALLAFAIIGLSSWWPAWLASLVVVIALLLIAVVLALLGVLRFKRIGKTQNPVQSIAQDVKEVRDEL